MGVCLLTENRNKIAHASEHPEQNPPENLELEIMLIWGLTKEVVFLVLIVFVSIFIHADQVSYLHIIHPVNETMIVRLTADRHIHHFYILNSRLLNQSINQKHVLLINKG